MQSSNSKYSSRLDRLCILAVLMELPWDVMRYFKQVSTAEVLDYGR